VTTKDIDHRVDVFALGCVLYQATVGRRPFHGADALATMYQLLEEEVKKPSDFIPDYPPDLEAILLKALAKPRDERFQSALELHRALEKWLVDSRQLVGEDDIATLLRGLMGERILSRNKRIFEVLRSPDVDPVSEPPPPPSGDSSDRTVAGTSDSQTTDRAKVPQKSRWGVAVGFAAAAAAIAVWLGAKEEPSSTPAPGTSIQQARTTQSPEPAEPKKAEPTKVSFSVAASPRNARILLDGKPVGVGNFSITAETSTELHDLEVSAPGYVTRQQAVSFDRTHALIVELDPEPKAEPPARGRIIGQHWQRPLEVYTVSRRAGVLSAESSDI
jgi:serine/threonine-protein kinase